MTRRAVHMTLQEQGFRYMVSADKDRFGWAHPADVEDRKLQGYTDCTDMTDAELEAFVFGK